MKDKFYLLICALFLFSCSNEERRVIKTKEGIVYQTQNDSVVVSVLSKNIVRVNHYARPYKKAVDQVSVVLPVTETVDWKLDENKEGVNIITDEMTVTIDDSCLITFRNKNGEPLTSALQPEIVYLKQRLPVALCHYI
ncbi:MAG TPA: hypothetical protein VFC67_15105 [Prolixibacteraceae bacterium]|nr:hypothetical protein [Prolixibacteraceae bacterium]